MLKLFKSSLFNLFIVGIILLGIWFIFAHLHLNHQSGSSNGSKNNKNNLSQIVNAKELIKSTKKFESQNKLSSTGISSSSKIGNINKIKSNKVKHREHRVTNTSSSEILSWKTYGSHISNTILNHHLILGLAADTDAKSFVMFCASIRDVSSNIDVIIFVNSPIPSRHIDIAERYNIVLYEYDHHRLEPSFIRSYHPSSIRWILFDRLLRDSNNQKIKQYSEILFADVRDTILQSDPFLLIPDLSSQFITVLENNGVTIGACGWNSGWVLDCFGQEILNKVANLNILCSGIGITTIDVAQQYLHTMSSILLGQNKDLGKKFPQCERNGVDQGLHNVLVHLGRIPHLYIKSEDNFLITHLQSSKLTPTADILKSIDGKPYAVVHQYDRWHSLQVALAVKYIYWTNCEDEETSWNDEEQCSNYTYVTGVDIFAGMCDIGSFRALTSSSCCAACDRKQRIEKNGLIRQCDAFAYTDGICFFKSCSYSEMELTLSSQFQIVQQNSKIIQNPKIMSAFKIPKSV